MPRRSPSRFLGGPWRRAALGLAVAVFLLALAAVVAFHAATRIAPARLRSEAERRLGEMLRAPVRLGSVRLALAAQLPWIQLEARDGRAEPLPGGGSVAAKRMTARIDPFLLAAGRFEVRGLQLEDVDLALPEPGEPAAEPGRGAAPAADLPSRAVALLESLAEGIRAEPCPLPDLEVRGLDLSLLEGEGRRTRALLRRGAARSRCSILGRRGEIELDGALVLAPGAEAELRLKTRASAEDLALEATLGGVPLRGLSEAVGIANPGLQGAVWGDVAWTATRGKPHEIALRLEGRSLRGPWLGRDGEKVLDLALESPAIDIAVLAAGDRVRVASARIADAGLALRGEAEAALPLGGGRPLSFALDLEGALHARQIRVAENWPVSLRPHVERVLSQVSSGRVERAHLEANTDAPGLLEMLEGGFLARPGEVKLELAVEGATLLAGEADRISDVSGTLGFDGDRLELLVRSARFREGNLPRLSATLSGISRLRSLDDVRCERPPVAARLPGIGWVRDWMISRRKLPYRRTWTTLHLDAERVSHPTLLCAIEDAVASIRRVEEGTEFRIDRAVWAGLSVAASGSYKGPPPLVAGAKPARPGEGGAIALALTVDRPPANHRPRELGGGAWARGRFALDVTSIGSWRTKGYAGAFQAAEARLELGDSTLHLDPGGALTGRAVLHLGESGPARFEVVARTEEMDLAELWLASGVDRAMASGRLRGDTALTGHLLLGRGPLADVNGQVSLRVRDGRVYRKVPVLLAIALNSGKLPPFGKREHLSYTAAEMVGRVENGTLYSEAATLEGPEVRIAASGKAQLSKPYEIESVFGIFFLPGLDSLVDRIPLAGRVLLGRDRNLVGAYFSVTGGWMSPRAELIPAKSIASGPASFAFEGLPGFVAGGIRAIESALLPERPGVPPPAGAKKLKRGG